MLFSMPFGGTTILAICQFFQTAVKKGTIDHFQIVQLDWHETSRRTPQS